MKLKNKVVIVTGSSRGLGKATAIAFAKAGAKVALLARTVSDLKRVQKEISSAGGTAKAYPVDITQKYKVDKVIKKIVADFGTIDILINNAGVLFIAPLEKMSKKQIDFQLGVNLNGIINLAQATLPILKKKNRGHIINISSTSGKTPRAEQVVYCATKYAVDGFSHSLKKELEGTGIKVTVVFPGGMKTNLFKHAKRDISAYMNPKNVAEILVFIVSRPDNLVIDDITINRFFTKRK